MNPIGLGWGDDLTKAAPRTLISKCLPMGQIRIISIFFPMNDLGKTFYTSKNMVTGMLNSTKLIVYTLLLSILCCSSGYAEHDLFNQLNSGKAVVLIINSEIKSDNEQYADWSHYLNQFASEVGESFIFHKVSTENLKKIIRNHNKYTKEYSMIFLKKGKPTYFYDGPILEPQVYKFLKLKYLDKPIKLQYLTQFAPEEVDIDLNHQLN